MKNSRLISDKVFRLIVENAYDYAIFTTDLKGQITSWNAGAQKILGFTQLEMIGRPARIIFTEEDQEQGVPEMEMAQALQKGSAEDERWHLQKNGKRFWASGMLMTFTDEQGRLGGFFKILRDRTEARTLQKALERRNEELKEFAMMVAHDIRAPLHVITNYITLLERGYKEYLDDKSRQYVHNIVSNISLLKGMVSELLAYATAGSSPAAFKEVSLETVISQATSSLGMDIRKKRAKITWEPLPCVLGEGTLLTVLFQNIIGNAIKYCERNPIIHIYSRIHMDQIIIAVQDNGIGIPQQHLDKIFSPFMRSVGADQYPGHGLGLATVRKIAEAHNGEVWAESKEGEGSVFFVSFPMP